jgi:hypothetical protein
MTYEMVMEMLEALGRDVSVIADDDVIYVDVNDFTGFDADGNECMRAYDREAVRDLRDALARGAVSVTGDFYYHYQFDGFEVILGYASYDI